MYVQGTGALSDEDKQRAEALKNEGKLLLTVEISIAFRGGKWYW